MSSKDRKTLGTEVPNEIYDLFQDLAEREEMTVSQKLRVLILDSLKQATLGSQKPQETEKDDLIEIVEDDEYVEIEP